MRIEELDRLAWNQEVPEELKGNERTYCIELAYVYAQFNAGRISKEEAKKKKNRLRADLQKNERVEQFGRQMNIEESERAKNAEIFKAKILKAENKENMLVDALCCVYMLTGDKAFHNTAQHRLAELSGGK